MIVCQNLHIGYGRTLLQVEDFELTSGVYILVGRNGSGKSTFLKTLSGQIPAISGEIKIEGTSVHTLTPAEIPKKIAFVSAHFPMVDFLRVSEYIAMGRSPHTTYFGKMSKDDQNRVEEAIESIGISYLRNRFTNELSDGERQMVAIARAFAQGTPVIALDEPTAFLDYKNKQIILEKLILLAESHQKCIILSSHDIDQSLTVDCSFLIISNQNPSLQLIKNRPTKEMIVSKAFS